MTTMGLLSASCSFTRFRILDPVPQELWGQIPAKLKQYAIQDIDDIPEAVRQSMKIIPILAGPYLLVRLKVPRNYFRG